MKKKKKGKEKKKEKEKKDGKEKKKEMRRNYETNFSCRSIKTVYP